MRKSTWVLALVVAAAAAAPAQTYHAAEYVSGGAWATIPQPPNYHKGIILLRGDGTVQTALPPPTEEGPQDRRPHRPPVCRTPSC